MHPDQEWKQIAEKLQLAPLPVEGGLYRQTWLGEQGTAIYYLLHGEAFSHFHMLKYDEIWHHYLGDPVLLYELLPEGRIRRTILGKDLAAGQEVQHIVPAGSWQGACLLSSFPGETAETPPECGYALLGTTMSPGYTDDCYTHGDSSALLALWPSAEAAIRRLCSS